MSFSRSPLLKALWHSMTVVCGALFWLMSIGFLAGGITLMGARPVVGQVSVGFVVILLLVRFTCVPKYIKPQVFSIIGVIAYVMMVVVLEANGQNLTI